MRGTATFFLMLAVSTAPEGAAAQPLFLSSSDAGSSNRSLQAASLLAAELAARAERVLTPARAGERFEQSHSSSPAAIEAGELEALRTCADEALHDVAFGRYGAAQQTVERCLEIGNRALTAVNRETDAARQLFDACLYMVRARLGLGDQEGARAEATRCRVLVPDLAPSEFQHPPEVRALVAEVDRALQQETGGSLEISAASGDACRVFVNGRRLGTTPMRLERLPPGEYRVQLECESGASRVHRAVLGAEHRALEIDVAFEAVVRSADGLALAYPNEQAHEHRRLPDAVRVAGIVRPTELFLVSSGDERTVRVDRIDVPDRRVVASAWLGWDPEEERFEDPSSLGPAIEALREGRTLDFRSVVPQPRTPWTPPEAAPAAVSAGTAAEVAPETAVSGPEQAVEDGGSSPWVGWTLAGGAVLSYAATVYLWTERWRLHERFEIAEPVDPDYLDRQQAYLDSKPRHVVASLVTMPLSAAAVALLLPETDGVPWWSWIAGAAGIGAGAWAASAFLADGSERCSSAGDCSVHRNDGWGWVVAPLSVATLAVPATYLLRGWLGGATTASASAGPDHAMLRLRGTLP